MTAQDGEALQKGDPLVVNEDFFITTLSTADKEDFAACVEK